MDGLADRSAVERRFQLCCGLASVFSISLSYTVYIFLFVWLSLFTVKSILFFVVVVSVEIKKTRLLRNESTA